MILTIVPAKRGRLRRRQWVGQVVASNGRELFRTSETYNNPADVLGAFRALEEGLDDGMAVARIHEVVAGGGLG